MFRSSLWIDAPDPMTGLYDGSPLVIFLIACLMFCISVHGDYTLVYVHDFWSFWTLTLAVIYIG